MGELYISKYKVLSTSGSTHEVWYYYERLLYNNRCSSSGCFSKYGVHLFNAHGVMVHYCDEHYNMWIGRMDKAFDHPEEHRDLITNWLHRHNYPLLHFKWGQLLVSRSEYDIYFCSFYWDACKYAQRAIMQIFLIGGLHKDVRRLLAKILWKDRIMWVDAFCKSRDAEKRL